MADLSFIKLLPDECNWTLLKKDDIGSVNDVVSEYNKPLAEPMLIQISVATCHH